MLLGLSPLYIQYSDTYRNYVESYFIHDLSTVIYYKHVNVFFSIILQ